MSAMNTSVSRRAALTTVLLSAMAAASAFAQSTKAPAKAYTPKFTWWAILIMMIGIVVVITVALVVYFCVFRKEETDDKDVDSDDANSEGTPAVPASNNAATEEAREPAHKTKDYPVE